MLATFRRGGRIFAPHQFVVFQASFTGTPITWPAKKDRGLAGRAGAVYQATIA
jgi:hypothetical protein